MAQATGVEEDTAPGVVIAIGEQLRYTCDGATPSSRALRWPQPPRRAPVRLSCAVLAGAARARADRGRDRGRYLRRNAVEDIAELGYLVGLTELRVLWLSHNPIANVPNYRMTVGRRR